MKFEDVDDLEGLPETPANESFDLDPLCTQEIKKVKKVDPDEINWSEFKTLDLLSDVEIQDLD